MPSGSVWRSRDFELVFWGGLVNNTGDWLFATALPAFIYTETGSGRSTAVIIVIQMIAGVGFGPYGGSLADRWDLRRTVSATSLLQALALIPLLAVDRHRIWPAFIAAGLQGLLTQVNDPASFALLPRLVTGEQLGEANAANAAGSSIARLVGAPLGGILVVLGGLSAVVIADGLTFLSAAVATFLVRAPTGSLLVKTDDAASGGGVMQGWREIRGQRTLLGYVGVQTLASVAFAMFPVIFVAFVIGVLKGNAATVGLIRGVAALGGLLAAFVVGRVARNTRPTTLMVWGYVGLGAVVFLFVNASNISIALWIFYVLFALSGLPNTTSQVGATGAAQRLCPPVLLGRLQGVLAATTAVGAIIGSVVAGLLIDTVGAKALFNVQAALYTVSGIAAHLLIARHLQPAGEAFTGATADAADAE